ncbi:hypothetical protein AQUCO_01300554v1 [Aquilegia coerulea]|uniref:VTT domain-containing protein n=1 Tax=Aquilegia coerulea TaxID=218851 RepID=A0A2G5E2A0_AQUCA|nr:hypothetical protein AQUCO_01300554v1 [Aquilegia coerulea]PIA49890.1 hypothetical protein AQUCO_01300554v1 [Aquilegia coerulea]
MLAMRPLMKNGEGDNYQDSRIGEAGEEGKGEKREAVGEAVIEKQYKDWKRKNKDKCVGEDGRLGKEVVPILDWEIRTFSPLVLGVFLFASLVLFPSILLPSTPSIWVAGITFGYGFGFLLILPAMSIGMSLPYFIGSLFRHKINMWLEKWPEKAAFMRLAGEGNWFHQFRAVFLLRISPFPFVIYNYAAVATNVKYGPYILGSVAGVVPEIFVTIYSGILIRRLADASQSHHSMSTTEIIYNCIGFSMTTAATVAITIYAKRALKKLQSQEELLD